jgi:Uma2 family endonuclease
MTWNEVLQDSSLQNLPYKIELTQGGKIEMSPASNRHGWLQAKIIALLSRLQEHGTVLSECSIDTSAGVKVADVVWFSQAFWNTHVFETPFTQAPELCIEIISPSNSRKEIREKIKLYTHQGVLEVWTCNLEGEMQFYTSKENIEQSVLIPAFPLKFEL